MSEESTQARPERIDVIVRRAVPADGMGIAEVNVRGWQAGYGHIFSAGFLAEMGREMSVRAARVSRSIAEPVPPGSRILVAELEGTVVAYSDYGPARPEDDGPGPGSWGWGRAGGQSSATPHLAEVYAFYVDPWCWRRGAGTLLMAATVDDIRRLGYPQAVLWVLEDNPRARAFYESAGWHADGGRQIFARRGEQAWEVRYRRAI